ncbi:MAG: hypothetical protein ACE5GD_07700 [Candidatus Geothermarchaeales archaeon]
MDEKKRKRKGLFDVFGFEDVESLFEDFDVSGGPGGSGYSISVTYDEAGKPVVKVKAHGDIDKAKLREDIERKYPGAKIIGLEKEPLIRFVDEGEEEKE